MATNAPTSHSTPAKSEAPCCSPYFGGGGLGYLLLRVLLGCLLLFAAADKFKSPTQPYQYSFDYWHDKKDSNGIVTEPGRWLNVARPVFTFGGFDNKEYFGEKVSNFFAWNFYYYAQLLPYAMLIVGGMILIGFLNHLALAVGGAIWLSLAIGQMTLPDNPTVLMLSIYVAIHAIALALVKHNRFALTRV